MFFNMTVVFCAHLCRSVAMEIARLFTGLFCFYSRFSCRVSGRFLRQFWAASMACASAIGGTMSAANDGAQCFMISTCFVAVSCSHIVMARRSRVEYAGAFYHVLNRGNDYKT